MEVWLMILKQIGRLYFKHTGKRMYDDLFDDEAREVFDTIVYEFGKFKFLDGRLEKKLDETNKEIKG